MHQALDILIDRFRRAQDLAVDTLLHDLSIPLPESNRAWPLYCAANGLHETRELNGIGIYAHGYGVELKINDLVIDFDWGDNGEPDGFDSWRLWNFQADNCPDIECSHNAVKDWLETAFNDGELIKDTSLYYAPRRRTLANSIPPHPRRDM